MQFDNAERWEFVIKGARQSVREAFTYIGFGDHECCVEGAVRTFFHLYPEEAVHGYTFYLRSEDKSLMVLFSEEAFRARKILRFLEAEAI